ncbi:cobalamin-dependent protein [Desulforhopalus vacuolatus]|nr:cobalamin-dependent protein [Desulforhopalus vacuolatus]
MISPHIYHGYMDALLQGNRRACNLVVKELIDQGLSLKLLYEDLFKASLYHVGELWERNKISVAREHLATSVTEFLMTQIYPLLFTDQPSTAGTAVISCTANEFHQVGGKMAADIFEFNGWDTHFLGANTPMDHLIAHLDETKPDLLGLSLSIYFNLPELTRTIEAVRHHYPHLDIFTGGQGFLHGGRDVLNHFSSTRYIPHLDALETEIKVH